MAERRYAQLLCILTLLRLLTYTYRRERRAVPAHYMVKGSHATLLANRLRGHGCMFEANTAALHPHSHVYFR